MDLIALGWKQTRSGKYTHPRHTAGPQGRHVPVVEREAERIEKQRIAAIEREKLIDPGKRLVTLALLGSLFDRPDRG
jgi:hypothetical protein